MHTMLPPPPSGGGAVSVTVPALRLYVRIPAPRVVPVVHSELPSTTEGTATVAPRKK